MQFSTVAVALTFAASALAGFSNETLTITTDVVVTDFTTYCPESTEFVINNKTVTVTAATTLTITGPCTIPSTYTTVVPATSSAPAPAPPAVSSVAGAATYGAGALAGLAAVAAALL